MVHHFVDITYAPFIVLCWRLLGFTVFMKAIAATVIIEHLLFRPVLTSTVARILVRFCRVDARQVPQAD